MELKAKFAPTAVNILAHPTNSDAVVFGFDDGKQAVEIYLMRAQLPQFLSGVQREARAGPAEVLDPRMLAIGDIIQPIGHEFRRQQDGCVLLTFHLQTDDGARSVPMNLSSEKAKELADFILATA